MNAYNRYFLMRMLLSCAFGAACGVLLLAARPFAREVFDISIIAIGLMTALLNLPALSLALRDLRRKGEWINFLVALLSILLGVSLMLLDGTARTVFLVLFAAVFPAARTVLVADHKRQLLRELPRILLGTVLLVLLFAELEDWVFLVGAILSFAWAALCMLYGVIVLWLRREKNNQ